MVYIDLRKLAIKLDHCNIHFAVPRASNDLGVISFAYFKSIKHLEHFLRWCLRILRLGKHRAIKYLNTAYINDMILSGRYIQTWGSSTKQSKKTGIYELPTQFIEDEDCCLCVLDHERLIFDACVLGQYFGGTYAYPNQSHWEANRLIDPRGMVLEWKILSGKIKIPYIKSRRIINIHVHSKQLEKFSSADDNQTTGF